MKHRVILSVVSCAAATAVTLALWDPLFHRVPFALYFAAVALSAWYGGWIWGMATAFAGVLVVAVHQGFHPNLIAPSIIFFGVSGLIAMFASARSRAMENLRVSHARKIAVIEGSLDCIIEMDHQGRVIEWNPAAARVFGYTRDETIGKEMAQIIIPPHLREQHRQGLARYLDTGEGPVLGKRIEISAMRKDGIEFPVELTIARLDTGWPPTFTGHLRDITERKRDHDALRDSEERFRAAFDQAVVGVVLTDLSGRVLRVNDAFCRIVGRPGEELIGRDSHDYTHPDDRKQTKANLQRIETDGLASVVYEKRYVRKDATVVWGQVTLSTVRGRDGKLAGTVVLVENVTDRKRNEARDRFLFTLEDAIRLLADPEEITLACAKLLGEHLEADRCAYADVEADEDTFNLTGNYNRGVPSIIGRYRFADFGVEVLQLMREDKPYVVNDVDTHEPPLGDLSYYRQTMIQAVICVPAHKAGKFVAAMAVHQKTARRWTVEEVKLVRVVAERCWESIERARAVRVLRQSEAEFRLLADAMPQIVWAAGPDGQLDYYNRQWFEYIKLSPDETDEARWDRHLHPDDLHRVYQEWSASLRSGTPYNIEFRVRRADGAYRWFLVRALPIRSGDGSVVRWFGTCTDVHDHKALEEQNEKLLESERSARTEAERASHMKDEFLATLSHELRTPLTAILGWSQILAGGSKDAGDLSEGLRTIERNARAQTRIIEDLLEMSRINAGKVRLDVQRIDLASIVHGAIETAKPAAEAKGIRLLAVLDPSGGPVSGDPNRLQQVMWNLLSNAIKFTPKGGRVQVLLERVNSHLEVSVIDTGEGIKPEFLAHVFDRFRQADPSSTRRHGGLGLGLSIAKQLVELHGGSIRAKSSGVGMGATFTVSLPLTIVHPELDELPRRHPAAATTDAAPQAPCVKLTGVKVLVVDDEPDARNLVRRLLEDCEATVTTAGSASEALILLQSDSPDVLVSDIGMPDVDGYALIRQIRALGPARGGNISAVALTAYARAEDRMQSVRAGFQMHIAKPVEPAELVTMVASLAKHT